MLNLDHIHKCKYFLFVSFQGIGFIDNRKLDLLDFGGILDENNVLSPRGPVP